jgi:hypothetical protein
MYKNKDNYCSLNHSHLIRHHNLLLSIHSRLHKTQNSTRYYCVKFYNALPLYLKNMDFKPFKLHLKQLLTENAFYSFEEFYSFTKSLQIFCLNFTYISLFYCCFFFGICRQCVKLYDL